MLFDDVLNGKNKIKQTLFLICILIFIEIEHQKKRKRNKTAIVFKSLSYRSLQKYVFQLCLTSILVTIK